MAQSAPHLIYPPYTILRSILGYMVRVKKSTVKYKYARPQSVQVHEVTRVHSVIR